MSWYERNYYLLRKLHSLSGIIPVGLFLLEHIFTNSFSTRGPEAYNRAVQFIQSVPYLVWFEIGLIIIPIYFHGILGLLYTFTAKSNFIRYPFFHAYLYYFQRVTGVILIIYITLHAYQTRVVSLLTHQDVTFDFVKAYLSNPLSIALTTIGLFSAVFHFTNGIWMFLITWGITASPRSQRFSLALSTLFGVGLFAAGLTAMTGFFRTAPGGH